AHAALPYVYDKVLPPDGMARILSRKRFSCSAISFFWGLDRRYVHLPAHTLFLADDYRANFESIVRDHGLPANQGVNVHAPARLEAAGGPPQQDPPHAVR